MIVSTPAAASTPQSNPEARDVRVMVAAIGLAVGGGQCAGDQQFDPGEHKAEEGCDTDAAEAIRGVKILTKNFGKE